MTEIMRNQTMDFSKLYNKRGRPKMKPEDKKPRKRSTKQQQQIGEIQQEQSIEQPVEQLIEQPIDDVEVSVQKLKALKTQWNRYYKRNRERILKRKKELREAKEKLLHETLGMQKVERRGRKPKVIDIENIGMIKCLQ
jgi:hypothetical protein